MKAKQKSLAGVAAIATVAVVAVAALASAQGSASRASTVKTGRALGRVVLVNQASRTLYSLSAESHGRFICTGSCLSVWHPLTLHPGQKPTGSRSLGTVRRPEGVIQVTYKGKPLYTFSGDHKSGEAKGDGFKDVGVWHPAFVGSAAKAPAASPAPMSSPQYGY